VHGELRHLTEHARLARELQVPRAIVATNGQMIRLAPGDPDIVDETPAGRLHLDGRVLVHEEEGHARERRALSFAGLVAITLIVNRKRRLAADPVFYMEGIPAPVEETIRDAVARAIKEKIKDEIEEHVRIVARRAANEAWGKKPVVRVKTVEI
jgi:ribonuclease J